MCIYLKFLQIFITTFSAEIPLPPEGELLWMNMSALERYDFTFGG